MAQKEELFAKVVAYAAGNTLLDEHLERLRSVYPRRREAMLAALREVVPHRICWNEPAGGFFLWCHLEEGLRSKDLLAEAAQRRVAFVVGEAFHADGSGQNAFRLNFTYQDEQGIREGIRRLGQALTALLRRRQEGQVPRWEAVRPIV